MLILGLDLGCRTLYLSYLKLQRCWLRSFTPITWFAYAHGDSLTCRLPATPSCLGISAELFVSRII
ncbi:hypothetical protein DDM94_13100 [Vibrio cholerae]|nr:hypothetical protein [Vibrio cholerae]